MIERLAPADLDAIQARADAATPGPWRVIDNGPCPYGGTHPEWHFYAVRSDDGELDISGNTSAEDPFYAEQGEADAAFIAAARADVPALVAEVRALQQELRDMQPEGYYDVPPEIRDLMIAATPGSTDSLTAARFADDVRDVPPTDAKYFCRVCPECGCAVKDAKLLFGANDFLTYDCPCGRTSQPEERPMRWVTAEGKPLHEHPFPLEEGTATC